MRRSALWSAIALLALLLALAAGGLSRRVTAAGAPGTASPDGQRFLVLGIDGVDYDLLKDWMDAGQLPNFTRLSEMGGFKPLETSMPPQSPVAWSNFITGMNSGGHGIFDFIHRDPRTMLPYSALSAVEPPPEKVSVLGLKLPNKLAVPFSDYVLPLAGGKTINLRQGKPFWDILTEHGVHAVVQRVPVNFPPDSKQAFTLSGMGTPDIQGTNGTYSYYTNSPPPEWETATGGKIYLVDVIDGVVEDRLYGPPNDFINYDRIKRRTGRSVSYQDQKASIPFKVYVDSENAVAKVLIDGQEIFLKEGEFSPWIPLRFSLLPAPGLIRWAWHDIVSVRAIVRFYLKSTHPDFGLYVTPVDIDPVDPALPISTPAGYSQKLAKVLGRFYTQGMPADTKALEKDVFGNADFLKQEDLVIKQEMDFAEYELQRFDRGFLFLYFSAVDQIGHVMWRTLPSEASHPAHDAILDAGYEDTYPNDYRIMDRMVGRAMELLDGRTTLIVMSDHGFASWRRAFDLNRWLYENGYLALQAGVDPATVEYFGGIDWQNTQLYSAGINGLYVNQLGRERNGVVPPGPIKAELLAEVAAKLEAVVDPATGEHPISKVYMSRDIYTGPLAETGPDAQIGFEAGYRLIDESALGGMTGSVFSDNRRRWSGDHCQDYQHIPGVILSNRPIRKYDPSLVDMAPTILEGFGIAPPENMIGRSVF
jgi:predicted AlkP superfamily phosphohydrolase/phosphomutase